MKYIHSLNDLHRYVCDGAENIQISCYDRDYDSLIEAVSDEIYAYLCGCHDFRFGDPLPEQFDDDNFFWGFFEPYEKEEV